MVGTRKSKSGTLASALVSVAGEASDAHAVRLACDLLGPQKGELYIVYVIEVGMGLPVDAEISPAAAKGEQVLKEMEEVARPYKSRTQAELLQSRRTGSAVVQEAMDKEVDAIVLGVVGANAPEGNWILIGRLATFYYFFHFLVILPVVGWVESPKPLPDSISTSVLGDKKPVAEPAE